MIKVVQYLILILACLVTPLKAEKIKEIKIERPEHSQKISYLG